MKTRSFLQFVAPSVAMMLLLLAAPMVITFYLSVRNCALEMEMVKIEESTPFGKRETLTQRAKLGADGRAITLSGMELGTARAALAYNLSIAGVHTYHVGDDAILVHNDCSDAAWDIASKAFGTPGRAQELGFSSIDEIGAYVERVMGSGRGALRDD